MRESEKKEGAAPADDGGANRHAMNVEEMSE